MCLPEFIGSATLFWPTRPCHASQALTGIADHRHDGIGADGKEGRELTDLEKHQDGNQKDEHRGGLQQVANQQDDAPKGRAGRRSGTNGPASQGSCDNGGAGQIKRQHRGHP